MKQEQSQAPVKYEHIASQVNSLLAQWDPIGVPEEWRHSEYTDYVRPILIRIDNRDALIAYLIHMLRDIIGLSYDANNPKHRAEIIEVADKIMSLREV
jgi:hypothetical protein